MKILPSCWVQTGDYSWWRRWWCGMFCNLRATTAQLLAGSQMNETSLLVAAARPGLTFTSLADITSWLAHVTFQHWKTHIHCTPAAILMYCNTLTTDHHQPQVRTGHSKSGSRNVTTGGPWPAQHSLVRWPYMDSGAQLRGDVMEDPWHLLDCRHDRTCGQHSA